METRDSNEVMAVGSVPDELLLLCGRPDGTPSAWWTPVLATHTGEEAERLVTAASAVLEEAGLRDAEGTLHGGLGEVAEVVAAARVVLLVESTAAGGGHGRRSVVAAEHRALLVVQDRAAGLHDLLLCGPRATVALVAELLRPAAPASGAVRALVGTRRPEEVEAVLPESSRHGTLRLTRTVVGEGGTVHHATVVHHGRGSVVAWAAPDGLLEVRALDEEAAVELAGVLLGAEHEAVAA